MTYCKFYIYSFGISDSLDLCHIKKIGFTYILMEWESNSAMMEMYNYNVILRGESNF